MPHVMSCCAMLCPGGFFGYRHNLHEPCQVTSRGARLGHRVVVVVVSCKDLSHCVNLCNCSGVPWLLLIA